MFYQSLVSWLSQNSFNRVLSQGSTTRQMSDWLQILNSPTERGHKVLKWIKQFLCALVINTQTFQTLGDYVYASLGILHSSLQVRPFLGNQPASLWATASQCWINIWGCFSLRVDIMCEATALPQRISHISAVSTLVLFVFMSGCML